MARINEASIGNHAPLPNLGTTKGEAGRLEVREFAGVNGRLPQGHVSVDSINCKVSTITGGIENIIGQIEFSSDGFDFSNTGFENITGR